MLKYLAQVLDGVLGCAHSAAVPAPTGLHSGSPADEAPWPRHCDKSQTKYASGM